MDGVDLAEMFERASANRRIASPRSAIATLIFDRMRQQFPDAPIKTKRSKPPAAYWKLNPSPPLIISLNADISWATGDNGKFLLPNIALTATDW
jgi:hypothetical protein